MSAASTPTILCNGAESSDGTSGNEVHLDYRSVDGSTAPMALELPSFVASLGTLPDRILDLLEIAPRDARTIARLERIASKMDIQTYIDALAQR